MKTTNRPSLHTSGYLFIILLFSFCHVQSITASSIQEVIRDTIPIQKVATKKITGTITDTDGNPISGVSINLENSDLNSSTDVAGNFEIAVPDEAVILAISFPGYSTNYVNIKDRTIINLVMSETEQLEETVTIGYGIVKKSTVTGSLSSIPEEQITAFPMANTAQALQGRAAGVAFQYIEPTPSAKFKKQIRSAVANSLSASSASLWVVDGFVGGLLPVVDDIASIAVLKDAVATSIYGSRATNGVILITTKRGKEGTPLIRFNSYVSSMSPIKKIALLDANEYSLYQKEINPDHETTGLETDWQDEIFRKGLAHNHQLSISGGSEAINYYISGTYYGQKGIVQGSGYDRLSLMSNLDVKAGERLTLGINFFGFRATEDIIKTQETRGGEEHTGVITAALKMGPDQPIFDENGDYTKSMYIHIPDRDDYGHDNPIALLKGISNEAITDQLQTTFSANFELSKHLSFRSVLGLNNRSGRESESISRLVNEGFDDGGKAEIEGTKETFFLTTNYLTYTKLFQNKHDLTLMTGYSYERGRQEKWQAEADDFISNDISIWGMNQDFNRDQEATSRLGKNSFANSFSRLNYAFDNKYVFTLNANIENNSKNKLELFPSAGIAWNMHEEKMLQGIKQLSLLKWRVSFGITTNELLDPYQSTNFYGHVFTIQDDDEVDNVIAPIVVNNRDLTSEETDQRNIGMDLGLLKNRVKLTVDYYQTKTTNLLFLQSIPSYTGYTTQWKNDGELKNKGLEFSVFAHILDGPFLWTTTFNISGNRSKTIELPQRQEFSYNTSPRHLSLQSTHILQEGEPIATFYGYVYEGNSSDGSALYKDINDDGIINAEDRTIIGNPHPDFYFGFDNTFRWKNFDLNVFLYGSQGNDILSFTLMELETLNKHQNTTERAYNEWTKSGSNALNINDRPTMSSQWVFDGSYIRFRNISIGYSFPKSLLEKWKLEQFRCYISAQNIWTLTSYRGYDPEVHFNANNRRNSALNIGLDFGSYPNAKAITFGINLGF